MDILELPIVTTAHTLREAIERMKETDRRAVVLRIREQELYLCTNREIAEAWAMGFRRCSELVEKIRQSASMEPLVALRESPYRGTLESSLDSEGRSFGILIGDRPLAEVAAVVTRHEGLGAALRNGTKVCMCTGPLNHPQECPPVEDGEPCRDCTLGVYECF